MFDFVTMPILPHTCMTCEMLKWGRLERHGWDSPYTECLSGAAPLRVSVIAGSHADEPAGPMTAQALPLLLSAHFPELLERCTFHVIPQMNPDGADANRAWFADPAPFERYARLAIREQPGDDIEFGFEPNAGARPECLAAMDFMESHAPFHVHASLHGMAFAHGAWFLLCREWANRATPFMDALLEICAGVNLPLHDIDRGGEKGFHRIRPGFCTTPHSAAMRSFFLEKSEAATAALFRPSSMEFAQSLGGNPLCLVSELPLFLLPGPPPLEPAAHQPFREALAQAKATNTLNTFTQQHPLQPLPFQLQMRLQLAMLVLGVGALSD